ncbi:MAG: acyltransferase family protein [Candidatus Bathyarchaeota archaeon]|nr:acyltransferase family protein [Candidatus Termiticorpusculum sp.]
MDMQDSPPPSKISVDLIRVVAICAVILCHAAVYAVNSPNYNPTILQWFTVHIYLSIGHLGVPLFIMLTGALLLVPSKKQEDLGDFFKKRFSRIGLPFLFWGVAYFIWNFCVEKYPITGTFIINGILSGPYIIFWYLYMLFGLYLLTPMLRVMVSHFTEKLFKYFMIIWFVGVALVPLISLASNGQIFLDPNVFVIPLCVGYFVLGAYFVNVRIRRDVLAALTISGVTLSVIATYFMAKYVGGASKYFFQDYSSLTIILAAVPLFILLNSYVSADTKHQKVTLRRKTIWKQRVMQVISKNSLAIFFLHMIILYTLQKGTLSVAFTNYINDDIIGVPVKVALSLILSLISIIPLKKIPYLKKFIG